MSCDPFQIPETSPGSREGYAWAKVERCAYEPTSSSIRTRVAFNELAVTGLVSLQGHEPGAPVSRYPAESCRMSLRLRRAGMEFYTSPIARGRGQMRIRTESSFLEPRFASIYAYGCRSLAPPRDRLAASEPRKREANEESLLLVPDDDENDTRRPGDNEELEDRPGFLVSSSTAAMLDSLWRSKNDIAREMEDIFLRSASQAITHYIEKQLHPAIKETLMLSMGYTISYG